MKINKKIFLTSCLLLASFFPTPLLCEDLDLSAFDLSSDSIDVDNLLREWDIDFSEMEEQNEALRNDAIAKGVTRAALDEVEELWGKTSGFRSRDPLYLIPQRRLTVDEPGIFCHAFYNMTNTLPVRPNIVLNKKATDLLLGLAQQGTVFGVDDTKDFDQLLRVLPFIDKMIVQERKVGGLIQANIVDGRWILQLETLLMLAERNFWVKNRKERKDLLAALGNTGKKDAMRMRFGLGDTRIKLGYNIIRSSWAKAVFGITGILPTSRIGRKKPRSCITAKVGDSRKKLINDLLNMNNDLMLEPKLGTGHWGLGCFLDMRIHMIPDTLDFWTRLSFNYLFPGTEYRFMPSYRRITLTQLGQLAASDTIPEGFPVANLFPCLAKGRVYPGSIFNATFGLDWKFAKSWKLGLGYDLYYQQAEKIKNVVAPNVDISLLRVNDCVASKIIQHKVFGELSYTSKGKHCDWHFGLGGDMTFAHQGASRDWTVYAKLGITF